MSRGFSSYNDEPDNYAPKPKGRAAPKAPPSRVARAYESDSESDEEHDARAIRRQENVRSYSNRGDNYDSRDLRDNNRNPPRDSRDGDNYRRDNGSRGGGGGGEFVPKSTVNYENRARPFHDDDEDDDYDGYRRGGRGKPTGTATTGGGGWKTAGNRDELEERENYRVRDNDRSRGDQQQPGRRRGWDNNDRDSEEEEEEIISRRNKGWQNASAAAKPAEKHHSRDRSNERSSSIETRERSDGNAGAHRDLSAPGVVAMNPHRRQQQEPPAPTVDDELDSGSLGGIEERLGKPDFEDDDVAAPVPRRTPEQMSSAQNRAMQADTPEDDEFNRKYGVQQVKNVFDPDGTSRQRKPFNMAANKPNAYDPNAYGNKYAQFPGNGLSPSPISIVNIAPRSSNMVRCTIIREKESYNPLNMTKFYPSYQLVLEETNKVILLAKKMNMNRTSNYHMFDMTRGQVSTNLTKKSGNYIGKLRSTNYQRSEYVLVTPNAEEREEIGGIVFDRYGLYDQLTEGTQPRKISVIVPALDADSCPIPHKPLKAAELMAKASSSRGKAQSPKKADSGSGSEGYSLVDMLRASDYTNCHVFESKDPMYEKGNYRLNFNGRVTVASVKNFQLVPPTNNNNVTVQFGKVGADHFHLDYKAPLNAVQAFALALCQFNI